MEIDANKRAKLFNETRARQQKRSDQLKIMDKIQPAKQQICFSQRNVAPASQAECKESKDGTFDDDCCLAQHLIMLTLDKKQNTKKKTKTEKQKKTFKAIW